MTFWKKISWKFERQACDFYSSKFKLVSFNREHRLKKLGRRRRRCLKMRKSSISSRAQRNPKSGPKTFQIEDKIAKLLSFGISKNNKRLALLLFLSECFNYRTLQGNIAYCIFEYQCILRQDLVKCRLSSIFIQLNKFLDYMR